MPERLFTKVRISESDDLIWKRLLELAWERKVKVYKTDYFTNINGIFVTIGGKDYICISSKINRQERNLVLAHELGHMMLHKNVDIVLYFNDNSIHDRIESEADRFARKLIKLLGGKIDE